MSPVFSFVVSVCTFKPKMMKWEDITDEARKATEQALTDLLTENPVSYTHLTLPTILRV